MNKYSDKSDFEINKAVAIAIGKVVGIRPDSNIIYLIGGDELIEFDPCNNPTDAMPIIIDNGISLIFQEGNFQFATYDGNIECSISNPLKAAMVIFLMMKDAENEKI